MKYKIYRDIDEIRLELSRIAALRELIKLPAWKHIAEIFHRHITRLTQDVLDKCSDPKKNELEIKCKKMLADGFADILYQIDQRVANEEYLIKQLNEKTARIAELADRQRLAQM